MVVRSRKKNVRQRGYKTHGWGSKKKHRGSGSKGGKGFAGAFRHKKIMVALDHPDHFSGRKGFNRPQSVIDSVNSINIISLSGFEEKEIDLTSMGYDKLLGRGKISRAVTIKVRSASENATKKIEDAGGKIVFE